MLSHIENLFGECCLVRLAIACVGDGGMQSVSCFLAKHHSMNDGDFIFIYK